MVVLDHSMHAIAIRADANVYGNDIDEISPNITGNECSLDSSTYRDSSVRVFIEVRFLAIEVLLDCFSDFNHLGAPAHHDYLIDLFVVEVF